jgi:hypothetical protein
MAFGAAIGYAQRGWLVFPCEPGGKRPLTVHGLLDASSDPAQLDRWAEQWPRANIGLRTGRESGLIVLDVDGDDGAESLRRLESANDPLPRTLSIVTPRGGAHYYFAHPGGEIRNSAGLLGAGLDVRGDGGYVIAPPSVGAGGVLYEVDDESEPAPLPAWLIDYFDMPSEHEAAPAETWIKMIRDGIPEGQRNASLTRLVGHLLRKDVDGGVVCEIAVLVGRHCCRPRLADREAENVVASVLRRELTRRGVAT